MIRFTFNDTFVSGMVARRSPREGAGDNSGGTGGQGTGNPAPTPAPTPQPPAGGGEVKFDEAQQTKVNALLAEERRKAGETNKKLVADLETLKQSKGLTEQEKGDLQKRIDDLQATYTTKEQQAQTEYQKLQKKYDVDVKAMEEQSKAWRSRHDTRLKTIDLRAAADHYGAIRSEQVEKLLWDQTVVEEVLGEDGRPTGEFATKVNFIGKDKDGKPVQLKLSPRDAVKAMTDIPDEYGNLFENKARGGVSQLPVQGGAGGNVPDIEKMTPQEWKQYRAKIKEQMARQS